MNKRLPTRSTLLPQEVRDALIAASKLPDELERKRAIEAVTERARRHYPHLFQTTEEGVTQ